MPKKKSRKKSVKLSSSSSEDEKASKEQDVTKNCVKRKRLGISHDSCTGKQESCGSLTVKDVSRKIKKAFYRLSKTPASDQRAVEKKEGSFTTNSTSMPYGESCSTQTKASSSSKTKANISEKVPVVTVDKPVESGPSKTLSTFSAGKVLQRTEKTSQDDFHNKSSQRTPSKLTKMLMSHGLISDELKEQRKILVKRRSRSKEPPRTGTDSKTTKTREPSETTCLSKYSRKRGNKLISGTCHQDIEKDFKVQRTLCAGAKSSSSATTEQSCTAKHTISDRTLDVSKHLTPKQGNVTPVSSCTPQALLFSLKKLKKLQKARPLSSGIWNNDNDSVPTINLARGTEPSESGPSVNTTKQGSVKGVPCSTHTLPSHDQQVAEELQGVCSEKRLKVDVIQSYEKLSPVDIDLPQEGATDTLGKQSLQKELILVLDTNILLSHLEYVKKIGSHGLGALGFPVILIPWVVLQELDSLKKGNRQEGDVAHLAIPALSYIHHCVKNRDPHFLAQSMQQAAKNIDGLKAENNDDRVLQCCLQYQSLYTGRALILCTNDKNLCTKSLVSGVTALSKAELEGAVTRSRPGLHPVLCRQTPMQPHADPQVPAPMLNNISPAQFQGSEKIIGLPLGLMKKGNKQPRDTKEVERRELSICVSELENCLKEVLSEVLEVEMKAAFDDLWEEIVYLKPPWTLHGILQCLRKHWVAVFGLIFPRRKLEAVLKLTDFLTTAKVECSNTLTALREAENLLKVFGNRSSYGGRIPIALHSLDTIICRLETQGECPVSDADMSDEEEKQVTLTQVSHQEVWTLFENIWDNVYPTSLAVFTALCFDPHTMQRAQPEGGPPPPQDALVCLHKLASMVSQLLQAFSRVLSTAAGLEDTQALLSLIHLSEVVTVESRFTAKDLLDCFSQQEYRERLERGGSKLMELKVALDCCVEAMGQRTTHNP